MSNQLQSNFTTRYDVKLSKEITSVAAKGWTDSHAATIYFSRVGDVVNVEFPEMNNAGLVGNQEPIEFLGAVPVGYRPTNSTWQVSLRIKRAGVWSSVTVGMVEISSNGDVRIRPDGGEAPYAWGNDGIRGFDQFDITYIV